MSDLLRISLFGQMPSGEEWSINPVYGLGGDFGTPVSPANAALLADSIANSTPPAGVRALWSTSTNFVGARVEARDLDGTLETQGEAVRSTASVGTGTAALPFQTAMCISLRSQVGGASGRGRLYVPATGVTLTTASLRPSDAVVLAAATDMAGWLLSIEQFIDVRLPGANSLTIWSRKLQAANKVVSIQAGNVLDVQRRRRDTLIETYQAVAYAGTA
jgi:hypothetical protein